LGERVDERRPVFQRGQRILAGRRAAASGLLVRPGSSGGLSHRRVTAMLTLDYR